MKANNISSGFNQKQLAIVIGVVVVVGLIAGFIGSGINNSLTANVISDSQYGAGKMNAGAVVLEDKSTNTAWQITHRGSAAGYEAGDLAVYYKGWEGNWSEKLLLDKEGNIITSGNVLKPVPFNSYQLLKEGDLFVTKGFYSQTWKVVKIDVHNSRINFQDITNGGLNVISLNGSARGSNGDLILEDGSSALVTLVDTTSGSEKITVGKITAVSNSISGASSSVYIKSCTFSSSNMTNVTMTTWKSCICPSGKAIGWYGYNCEYLGGSWGCSSTATYGTSGVQFKYDGRGIAYVGVYCLG
ncbi:MAG: hypothetical protein WC796_00890 [Candidatus Pacearchaeota archaeon]|jgi:hypothetical protein